MKKYLTSVAIGFLLAFIFFCVSFIINWVILLVAAICLALGFAGQLKVTNIYNNVTQTNGEKNE